MRAGKLRDLIEIHSYTSALDDFGQATKTYTLLKKAWAEAIPVSGTELETGGKYEGRTTYQFSIRHTAIDIKNRIVFNNQNFEIIPPIKNAGGRDIELVIQAVLDE